MCYPIYLLYMTYLYLFTKDTADGVAVAAAVVVLPIHVATAEAQVAGVMNVATVERTRPIVTVAAHVVHAAIVAAATSRKEQCLTFISSTVFAC